MCIAAVPQSCVDAIYQRHRPLNHSHLAKSTERLCCLQCIASSALAAYISKFRGELQQSDMALVGYSDSEESDQEGGAAKENVPAVPLAPTLPGTSFVTDKSNRRKIKIKLQDTLQ